MSIRLQEQADPTIGAETAGKNGNRQLTKRQQVLAKCAKFSKFQMAEILQETMSAFKRTQLDVKDNMYLFYDDRLVILGEPSKSKVDKSKPKETAIFTTEEMSKLGKFIEK